MRQRTSVSVASTRTSASSAVVVESPTTVRSVTRPTELAAAPFASGVPIVSASEDCCGGAHDPKESGAPCELFGLVQSR
jgi:hypothetical protein